jgi:hypothetical protein
MSNSDFNKNRASRVHLPDLKTREEKIFDLEMQGLWLNYPNKSNRKRNLGLTKCNQHRYDKY